MESINTFIVMNFLFLVVWEHSVSRYLIIDRFIRHRLKGSEWFRVGSEWFRAVQSGSEQTSKRHRMVQSKRLKGTEWFRVVKIDT